MKKIILLAVAALLLGSGASAQFLKFGAKGGINFNTFDVSSVNGFIDGTQDKPGWHLGLMSRIDLGGLYVQPELLYNSNTYEYDYVNSAVSSTTYNSVVRRQTLDLPVMLGFKLLFLRLEAGPVFTLGDWDKITSGEDRVNIDFDNPVWGYQAGVGVEIKKVTLGLRYSGYFSRTEQEVYLPDQTEPYSFKSSRDGRFMLSLGYFF